MRLALFLADLRLGLLLLAFLAVLPVRLFVAFFLATFFFAALRLAVFLRAAFFAVLALLAVLRVVAFLRVGFFFVVRFVGRFFPAFVLVVFFAFFLAALFFVDPLLAAFFLVAFLAGLAALLALTGADFCDSSDRDSCSRVAGESVSGFDQINSAAPLRGSVGGLGDWDGGVNGIESHMPGPPKLGPLESRLLDIRLPRSNDCASYTFGLCGGQPQVA